MASVLSRLAQAARSFIAARPGGLGTAARRGPTLPTTAGFGVVAPPLERGRSFMDTLRQALGLIGRGQRIDPLTIEDLERAIQAGAPPPPGAVISPPPIVVEPEDEYDQIEILGRDLGYTVGDFEDLQAGSIEVSSSNVFSYFYQPESARSGILYVTYLAPARGPGQVRTGPGPTYAYYDVDRKKYQQFRKDAEGSPGGAVWDHLRVRGSVFGHQVRYRLIAVSGQYIPRRATASGFKTRWLRPISTPGSVRGKLPPPGPARERELARRGFRRSTLEPISYLDRGEPDRGTPNRGR